MYYYMEDICKQEMLRRDSILYISTEYWMYVLREVPKDSDFSTSDSRAGKSDFSVRGFPAEPPSRAGDSLLAGAPLSEGAFPNDENPPSRGSKISHLLGITPPISLELGTPKRSAGLWLSCESAAGMSVPEASVTEHDGAMTLENDVGTARQSPDVQSEAEACAVKAGPDDFFRARVGTPDSGHVSAALLPGEPICHRSVRSADGRPI
jgi:hypothetical protein